MQLFHPLTYYLILWAVFTYYHTNMVLDDRMEGGGILGRLVFPLSSSIYSLGTLCFYIWLFTIKWYYPFQVFFYSLLGLIIFFIVEFFIIVNIFKVSSGNYRILISWLGVFAFPFLAYQIVAGIPLIK